jgi:L-aspartate oxidase
VRERLRRVMTDRVGVVRSGAGLAEAAAELELLAAELDRGAPGSGRPGSPDWFETVNLVQLGWAVAELAGRREESRGAHWRVDHPGPVADWRVRQTLVRTAGGEVEAGLLAVVEPAEAGVRAIAEVVEVAEAGR